jgi:predicted RNase H-like HicB family nuclease
MTNLTLDCEQEEDGRWLAEVPELPGVMADADSRAAAIAKAEILALLMKWKMAQVQLFRKKV